MQHGRTHRIVVQGFPDVRQIADTLGVEVEEAEAHSFDGALVRLQGSLEGAIAVRRSIREVGRKNFTIGRCYDGDTLTAEAEGLFIRVDFERLAAMIATRDSPPD